MEGGRGKLIAYARFVAEDPRRSCGARPVEDSDELAPCEALGGEGCPCVDLEMYQASTGAHCPMVVPLSVNAPAIECVHELRLVPDIGAARDRIWLRFVGGMSAEEEKQFALRLATYRSELERMERALEEQRQRLKKLQQQKK